jgi:transcriptional regulator with XRE-family HTH domain
MSELVDKLRSEFQDEEYRHSYAEECLNTMIASQIKVLREERELTQSALAKSAEMLQPRLSVMENADYSSWSVSTLKRLARALDLALSVKFEAFSEVILDFEEMSKETLSRPSFKDDPMFRSAKVRTHRAFRRRRTSEGDRQTAEGLQMNLRFFGELRDFPVRTSRDNSGYSPIQKKEESDAAFVGIAG